MRVKVKKDELRKVTEGEEVLRGFQEGRTSSGDLVRRPGDWSGGCETGNEGGEVGVTEDEEVDRSRNPETTRGTSLKGGGYRHTVGRSGLSLETSIQGQVVPIRSGGWTLP